MSKASSQIIIPSMVGSLDSDFPVGFDGKSYGGFHSWKNMKIQAYPPSNIPTDGYFDVMAQGWRDALPKAPMPGRMKTHAGNIMKNSAK